MSNLATFFLPHGMTSLSVYDLHWVTSWARMPYHGLTFDQDIFDAMRLRLRDSIEQDFKGGLIEGASFDIKSKETALNQMKNSYQAIDDWEEYLSLLGVAVKTAEPSSSSGRYKLEDAARLIAPHTDETKVYIYEQLTQAVIRESLSVFPPGSKIRYYARHVRPEYEEAYWDDLNNWLETSVRGTKWKFLRPIKNFKADPPFPYPPLRQDEWYRALEDTMYRYKYENSEYPDRDQVWEYLWEGRLKSYEITNGRDRDEDALFMMGSKPLSLTSFRKRWSYLFNRRQKSPNKPQ